MKDLIDYLNEIISDDLKVKSNSASQLTLSESEAEAKLREVILNFPQNKYRMLLITLDRSNLSDSSSYMKNNIFPIFKKECSSVDYILFIKENNTNKYYVFHIELKSNPNLCVPKKLLKKHFTSLKIVDFILTSTYLYTLKSCPDDYKNLPTEIYEGFVLISGISSGISQREFIEKDYNNSKKYKGQISKIKYYFKGILSKSKNKTHEIRIKELCSLKIASTKIPILELISLK
ncbi:hypothetical protein KSU07_08975 [Fusobacterium animalis]|uniref:hypothetical protein n=1 Tax=Fusobacterium animalis TaxID=76859 RepID=UPI0030D2AA8B